MLLQRCCRPPHRAPPLPLPLPLLGPAAAAASREARDLAGGEGLENAAARRGAAQLGSAADPAAWPPHRVGWGEGGRDRRGRG